LNGLKLLDKLGLTSPQRPYRVSSLFYSCFARRVARDLRKQKPDIVHLHGNTNFIPIMRRFNPHARIVLHAHDHALTDFDPALLGKPLNAAALVLGCSDYD
jgi:hypothetical protein